MEIHSIRARTDESKHLEHVNEKYMDEFKDYTETHL